MSAYTVAVLAHFMPRHLIESQPLLPSEARLIDACRRVAYSPKQCANILCQLCGWVAGDM